MLEPFYSKKFKLQFFDSLHKSKVHSFMDEESTYVSR
jgi:hypothetical protein